MIAIVEINNSPGGYTVYFDLCSLTNVINCKRVRNIFSCCWGRLQWITQPNTDPRWLNLGLMLGPLLLYLVYCIEQAGHIEDIKINHSLLIDHKIWLASVVSSTSSILAAGTQLRILSYSREFPLTLHYKGLKTIFMLLMEPGKTPKQKSCLFQPVDSRHVDWTSCSELSMLGGITSCIYGFLNSGSSAFTQDRPISFVPNFFAITLASASSRFLSMRDFCSGERPFSWLLGEESDDISVGGGEKLFSWPPGGEMEALLAGGGEKDMHSSSRDLQVCGLCFLNNNNTHYLVLADYLPWGALTDFEVLAIMYADPPNRQSSD